MKSFKSSHYTLGLLILFFSIFIVSCSKKKIVVRRQQPYGSYLTDATGRSVYIFSKDTDEKSKCYKQCAEDWPPVRVSPKNAEVVAGDSVDETPLSTIKRNDGTIQATFYGHPLYYYKEDDEKGEAKGQGKMAYGGKWYLIQPSGKKVDVAK